MAGNGNKNNPHDWAPGPICEEWRKELGAEDDELFSGVQPPVDYGPGAVMPIGVGSAGSEEWYRPTAVFGEKPCSRDFHDEPLEWGKKKPTQHKEKSVPDNVRQFVLKHYQEAQTLAKSLGHGVTVAEVLAVSGMESGWGEKPIATELGNYFGIHGVGTQGSEPAARSPSTQKAKFSPSNGYYESGQVFVKLLASHLTGNIGDDPVAFFDAVHQAGWATPNQHYAADMTSTGKNRGTYTLVKICLDELGMGK